MSGNDYTDFLPLDQNKNPGSVVSIDGVLPVPSAPIDSSSAMIEEAVYAFDQKIYEQSTSTVTATTYRMRGYYVAGLTFEYWFTTDSSSSPPTGHVLRDIEIEARLR